MTKRNIINTDIGKLIMIRIISILARSDLIKLKFFIVKKLREKQRSNK